MRRTTSTSTIAAALVAVCLVLTVGCSSAAKQKVADATKGPACTAITGVQSKVSGASLENLAPDQLAQVQSASQSATQAVDALGSKLPSNLSSDFDQAQEKLTDAVQDKQASAEQRKANLKSTGDTYSAKLDAVKTNLGC